MRRTHAFTLVELSIVLVILGLLTGGVLAGNALIRASERRALMTEYDRTSTAVLAFRDKYLALPGDITNATQFWGAADSAGNSDGWGSDCLDIESTSTETCNGDGNGRIGGPSTTHFEGFRAWQHLANAGLVEGKFTGTRKQPPGAQHEMVFGSNIPGSRYPKTGYVIMHRSATPIFGRSGHVVQFGGLGNVNANLWTPTIAVQDLYSVDIKADDGAADRGFLRAGGSGGCMDASDAGLSGNYILSATGLCTAWFFANF